MDRLISLCACRNCLPETCGTGHASRWLSVLRRSRKFVYCLPSVLALMLPSAGCQKPHLEANLSQADAPVEDSQTNFFVPHTIVTSGNESTATSGTETTVTSGAGDASCDSALGSIASSGDNASALSAAPRELPLLDDAVPIELSVSDGTCESGLVVPSSVIPSSGVPSIGVTSTVGHHTVNGYAVNGPAAGAQGGGYPLGAAPSYQASGHSYAVPSHATPSHITPSYATPGSPTGPVLNTPGYSAVPQHQTAQHQIAQMQPTPAGPQLQMGPGSSVVVQPLPNVHFEDVPHVPQPPVMHQASGGAPQQYYYQPVPYQGSPYQGGAYQAVPYQGGPYQSGPYQGAPNQSMQYQAGPHQQVFQPQVRQPGMPHSAQAVLPWGNDAISSGETAVVGHQAEQHFRKGADLAQRGAIYSARGEFLQGLELIANAMDTQPGRNRDHSRALASGLKALEESDTFTPNPQRMTTEQDLQFLVQSHETEILKQADLSAMTPVAARQAYLSYACQQLAFAVGHQPVGSKGLYALGRLHTLPGQAQEQLAANSPKSVALFQAALICDAGNAVAANELGVLLAKSGRLPEAKDAFQHSLRVTPQPATWHNLASVHRQLGESDLAARAAQESTLLAQRGEQVHFAGVHSVRVVEPNAFVQSGRPVDANTPPQVAAGQRPNQAAKNQAQPQSKTASSSWFGRSKNNTK